MQQHKESTLYIDGSNDSQDEKNFRPCTAN